MRKIRILTYIILFLLFSIPFWGSSFTLVTENLSASFSAVRDTVLSVMVDSTRLNADSLASDSLNKQKGTIDDIIDYVANDSIVMTGANWAYLYGESEVNYTTLTLKSENISMNMDSSIANATFGVDTVGVEFGYPIFSDNGVDYEAKHMSYNMKSKKMRANDIITSQGEGFITAGIAKKTVDDAFFMRGGRYTTCDDHECPHFYLALTKAKVKPKKNVVTGPAYLVIEGLPLPLGLPFGFFPFSDKYSSGVIMPTFGDEMDRGFFLRDGGYYFAINDNIDLSLTGDIYTKGSWGLKARSDYRKRYRYSGSFNAEYIVTKRGDKEIPGNYSLGKDFKVMWNHSQDPKANMFRTLSASVNLSTSSYDRNSLDSQFRPDFTTSNKSSSVSLTQRFPNSPWSMSATMNIDQSTRDSMISLTLPNMSVSMSRIAPFKRKNAVGKERWYEKIQMSYRGEFRNSIRTKENKLFKSNLMNDWQHAIKHTIPISATYSIFKYFNVTPSVNYTERWYTEKKRKVWDSSQRRLVTSDTTHSFHRVYDFNFNVSLQTKLYGFFKPVFDKKTTIRHVFTPSVSFNYAPDFSDPWFGYYDTYSYYDANGDLKTERYSMFEGAMFGSPGQGKQGNIRFDFQNNIEMKRETNDTIKKISLIDNLGVGFSYNMMADSMRWSDIGMNIRLKLSKSLTVNLNATFDPYTYDLVRNKQGEVTGLNRVNKMRISSSDKFGFGRLMQTSYSISPSINQDTFKKWFGRDEKKKSKDSDSSDPDYDPDDPFGREDEENDSGGSLYGRKKSSGEYDEDGYLKNEIKWTLSASYSFSYGYDRSKWNEKTREYKYKLVHNLSFNGSIQPTKNWSFNFNASYDFDAKKLGYMTLNLTRDLHCWTLSGSVNPIGNYKSFFVSIRANSSMLQDLKYEKRGRSSSYDPNWD